MPGCGDDPGVQALLIVLMCVAAAIVYGIAHDLVTAHVCVEYFTIGHPPVFDTQDPVLLAIGWGVIGTWWMGLALGIVLAFASRFGAAPKRDARRLARPIAGLLLVMGGFALAAGLVGHALARSGYLELVGDLAERVPPDRHAAFIGDMWAHVASYATGAIGGLILARLVWRARRVIGPP